MSNNKSNFEIFKETVKTMGATNHRNSFSLRGKKYKYDYFVENWSCHTFSLPPKEVNKTYAYLLDDIQKYTNVEQKAQKSKDSSIHLGAFLLVFLLIFWLFKPLKEFIAAKSMRKYNSYTKDIETRISLLNQWTSGWTSHLDKRSEKTKMRWAFVIVMLNNYAKDKGLSEFTVDQYENYYWSKLKTAARI